MVKVSDCGCCDCESAQEKEQIKERALNSINKVYTTDAKTYYPDGTGMVTLPIPSAEQIAQMESNTEKIATLEDDVKANAADITATQKDVDDLAGKLGTVAKGYTLYRNGEGKIMLQAEATDGSLVNSNTLDMIIPYQYDLISGTTNRSFKLQITMSDGSSYTTNDFVIPEGGGTDVTVTGIVLSKDTGDINRFHVGINLSDGTMIDSGYISMIDSVSGAVADGKLTITVNGVSSIPVELPEGVTYSAGNGIKIESGAISISDDLASRLTTIESDITNTLVVANRAFDAVGLSGSNLVLERGNGGRETITLPTSKSLTVTAITDMSQLKRNWNYGEWFTIYPQSFYAGATKASGSISALQLDDNESIIGVGAINFDETGEACTLTITSQALYNSLLLNGVLTSPSNSYTVSITLSTAESVSGYMGTYK